MKVKAFLFGMFLLLGTTAMFASTTSKELKKFDKFKQIEIPILKKEKKDLPIVSCTVAVSWVNSDGTKSTATVTTSCACTQQAACNAAYKIISLVIP